MDPWLKRCEIWLTRQYKTSLGLDLTHEPVQLRWLPADSLVNEVEKDTAASLVVEDSDIGWLLFLLPYEPTRLENQITQALGIRSRLLRESNYTGFEKARSTEDSDGSWRVGLVWLVPDEKWPDWQSRILELRRGSGAPEEISFDAVRVENDDVDAALDAHGLPRLLLYTRALLMQSATQAESWLSADIHVSAQLKNFSQQFDKPRASVFARQVEELERAFQPSKARELPSEARRFSRFRVRNFRNLDSLEVITDRGDDVQAIVLFGPNGTGKSSFAEALSLAVFRTSPQLEKFLEDEDLRNRSAEIYLGHYLTPFKSRAKPCYALGADAESPFTLNPDAESKRRFEGVVLNQEDTLEFTKLPRDQLAARVLKGYSAMADHLLSWLTQEEKRTNDTKLAFTRKYGLEGTIKRSETAYDRLAQRLLQDQLHRPPPEFLSWLDFIVRLSGEDVEHASRLVSAWKSYQATFVTQLAGNLSGLQAVGANQDDIAKEIRATLEAFDKLSGQSKEFHERVAARIGVLREQLDQALSWIEVWGTWLAARAASPTSTDTEARALQTESERLAKERSEIEKSGKMLRGRLELLEQAQQFLTNYWVTEHPDTCPVCNSNVADRKGIEAIVVTLKDEANSAVQALRFRHVELQNRQKELEAKLKSAGAATCPIAAEDQARLKSWLAPFLPHGENLEGWLIDQQRREHLKSDLGRMKTLPEAPMPYSSPVIESQRLADEFIALSQEADRALDDPQAIGEVKKAFEQRMEKVLVDHLPATLGKVWEEIALTLTTAAWLLPARPTLKLEQRGKSLSVQIKESELFVRYIYNAAERHVLGLAWFFTYFLAKRRFEEAWIMVDDPAQEMDQPSFRELVRFWETLLRLHRRKSRPLTLIAALHQEERALDAARATNGRLYVLGWQRTQDDSSSRPSVKKVVLLAPGFHPLKAERMFG